MDITLEDIARYVKDLVAVNKELLAACEYGDERDEPELLLIEAAEHLTADFPRLAALLRLKCDRERAAIAKAKGE